LKLGQRQLTIRDFLRHSNLNVANKYLQATPDTKRLAQDKLVGAILPTGLLSRSTPFPVVLFARGKLVPAFPSLTGSVSAKAGRSQSGRER
jgi:hypothetical protein